MRSLTSLLVMSVLSSCVGYVRVPPTGAPSPALRAALRDTSAATRLYFPQEFEERAARVVGRWAAFPVPYRPEFQDLGNTNSIASYEYETRRSGSVSAISDGRFSQWEGLRGIARVRFVVGRDGRVEREMIEVLSATDKRTARDAVKQVVTWHFEPARLPDGRAVRQLAEAYLAPGGATVTASVGRLH